MPHHPGQPRRLSRGGRLLPLLVVPLVCVLLATPALAQAEPRVNVTAAGNQQTIEPGECASYQVTITNEATPALPVDDEITVRVGNPSAGWTVNPNPARTLTLARGESESVTLGLCPGNSVARGATGSVVLTATMTNQNPLGDPADDQVVLSARVEEGSFLGIGDTLPTWIIWVALGAVGLLLATALVARRRPGAGVSLECREPSKEVPAGRGTSFPVRISNDGRSRDVVSLTTSPVPRGWDTFLPVVDVPLEPGEDQTVWISVKSPDDARPGDHVAVKVFARSSASGGQQASIDLLTTVRTTGSESAWGGGISAGGGGEEETSVYAPEGAAAVAVKRRRV